MQLKILDFFQVLKKTKRQGYNKSGSGEFENIEKLFHNCIYDCCFLEQKMEA